MYDTKTMYDTEKQASPRRRVLRILVVAAAVLVLTGIGIAAGQGLTNRTGGQPATEPSTGENKGGAAGDPASPNGAVGQRWENADEGLASVTWTSWNGIALPTSPQHGPLYSAGDLVRGFTHDEAGAVLAAIHIGIRSQSYPGPGIYRPTITEQMTGPDTDAYLAATESAYEANRLHAGRAPGSALPQPPTQFLGWRTDAPTRDSIPVHLLLAGQDTSGGRQCIDTRIHMVWRPAVNQDDKAPATADWIAVAPVGGDGSVAMSPTSCDGIGYTLLPRQG